ncbi:hypothetical protein L6452_10084 [Arctium lappa]|uniref:Uncharacterized protein n=1 Tax=Arctium lappa TaxID=4217 RepID=A0ACB9DLM2_ARCLA|nr:hypothetical protein L6452_10084 [Arctium lappa]
MIDFESEEEDDCGEEGKDRNNNQPVIQVQEKRSNYGSNDGQQQSNEAHSLKFRHSEILFVHIELKTTGVETLLKDLAMEDKDDQAPEKKATLSNVFHDYEQKESELNTSTQNHAHMDAHTKGPASQSPVKREDEIDFMFKMNFLVLFENLMADCNSMGSCNLSFIAKLKNELMVTKINWSKYIFDKMKTSKEKWRRDNDMCFYVGPLTYLTDKYKVRRPFVKGECNKIPHTPPDDLGKPEYIRFMDIAMKQLLSAREEAEKWLDSATSKFPNDDSFDIYKAQLENLFKTGRWTTTKPTNTSTYKEKGVNDSLAMVVFEDVDTTTPIDACWEFQLSLPKWERVENERCVDFNVTIEERRVHEWAFSALRDTM